MKISELQRRLKVIRAREGDIEIVNKDGSEITTVMLDAIPARFTIRQDQEDCDQRH